MKVTSILFIIFFWLSVAFCQNSLDSQRDLLGQYIGSWPPAFTSQDSFILFKAKLNGYLHRLKSEFEGTDSSEYYFRLGQAYHFGHNIDVPGSYKLAEKYLKKSIYFNVSNLASRIELGTLYFASDINKIQEAYELLLNAVNKDSKKKFLEARYTLAMCASAYGEDYIARKNALEYKSGLNGRDDQNLYEWMKFIFRNDMHYIKRDTLENNVDYKNYFTGFEVEFPKNLTLDFDEYYNKHIKCSSLSLKTPKAYSVNTDSITNAIFISAKNKQYYSLKSFSDDYFARLNAKKIKDRTSSTSYPNYESYIFQTTFHPIENYKGINTIIDGNEFFYIVSYMATENTFDQNYHYFEDFEKYFRIIPVKQ